MKQRENLILDIRTILDILPTTLDIRTTLDTHHTIMDILTTCGRRPKRLGHQLLSGRNTQRGEPTPSGLLHPMDGDDDWL